MEQKDNISSETTSLINIESPVVLVNVPVNSASEKYPPITIETDENQTETDSVDKVNEGKDLCRLHASSNDRVSLKEDHKSDRRIDSSPKIVRFADDQGLDLADVRHFSKHGLPQISKSAFADLNVPQSSSNEHTPRRAKGRSKSKRPRLIPMFHHPGADPQFFHRVRQQNVCLEDVLINGTTVKGIINVMNLGFQKLVQVSYTTNSWRTKNGVIADFVSSNPNDFSDRFEFVICPPFMPIGARLAFVIKYVVNGFEFWDNNFGHNYTFECVTDWS